MSKITFDVTLVAKTDLAFLLRTHLGESWVPRSRCDFEPGNRAPEHRWKLPIDGEASMHESYASEKELI